MASSATEVLREVRAIRKEITELKESRKDIADRIKKLEAQEAELLDPQQSLDFGDGKASRRGKKPPPRYDEDGVVDEEKA